MAAARAMYAPAPKTEAGSCGFDLGHFYQTLDVEVYPENWKSVQLFTRFSTQWNTGVSGPTGLKYEAIYPLLDKIATDESEWMLLFDDIQLLESEALKTMRSE